jgi:hypothetical protein
MRVPGWLVATVRRHRANYSLQPHGGPGTRWGPHLPPGTERRLRSHAPGTVHIVLDVQERVTHRPGGQGVAGSHAAVPTVSRVFSNVFVPQESPQESQPPLRSDPVRHATDRGPRRPTRACADTAALARAISILKQGRGPAASLAGACQDRDAPARRLIDLCSTSGSPYRPGSPR